MGYTSSTEVEGRSHAPAKSAQSFVRSASHGHANAQKRDWPASALPLASEWAEILGR